MKITDMKYPLLGKIEGAEKTFLEGRREKESELESAITYFLEFLRGFESLDLVSFNPHHTNYLEVKDAIRYQRREHTE